MEKTLEKNSKITRPRTIKTVDKGRQLTYRSEIRGERNGNNGATNEGVIEAPADKKPIRLFNTIILTRK